MNKGLFPLLASVALSAAGMGLTMPVVPGLLREVGHMADLGWRFGVFIGLYALMQFLFSPTLGALSDRFGRRRIIVLSLAGAVVDYIVLAFAPSLWMLFMGRAISGMTGAVSAVASAYVADVTPEPQRARRFGQMSAAFGIGFIAGPAIGGLLGGAWVRAPFLAAAALNAVNLVLTLLLLRESRPPGSTSPPLNPLAPLRWAFSFPALLPLVGAYVVLALVGEIGGTIWVVYGEDKFDWGPVTLGLSLALFGLFHALAQAFVVGPLSERWGERRALVVGIAADATAYVLIALATQGWMAFALLPLFCLGGIGTPALQSLLTAGVGSNDQGHLQGVLASMTSLASVFGPLLVSTLYFQSRAVFPGLVWIAGAALYLLCLPLLFRQVENATG